MKKLFSYAFSMYHLFLAYLGALIYRNPSKKIRVIGVTGTKGKSTTLALLYHLFMHTGKKAALVSSTSVWIGEKKRNNETGNSMPGRFFLQRFLAEAVEEGCEYACIEVTSQGVSQFRHRAINWRGAAFLGIHPEHIEAHGSFKNYLEAKRSFFTYASKKDASFFVHADDEYADVFTRAAGDRPVFFFSEEDITSLPDSLEGEFNKINVACVDAIASFEGIEKEKRKRAISSFEGLAGRMQIVCEDPFYGVVDYAHTPQSLKAVLSHLSKREGSLICVVGSAGGGRDRWKRPYLGNVAGVYCDTVIITNEDPYDEDPRVIMKEVYKGIDKKKREDGSVIQIEDRKEAIEYAVSKAQRGDCVVCTGKGSEDSIHIRGGKKIPWSDADVLKEVCERVKK